MFRTMNLRKEKKQINPKSYMTSLFLKPYFQVARTCSYAYSLHFSNSKHIHLRKFELSYLRGFMD